MRLAQLHNLSEMELMMLLYIVNVLEPIRPPSEITPAMLPYINHAALLEKVARYESHVHDEFKHVYKSLLTKLTKTWLEEVVEHADATKPDHTQLEFELWTQLTLPLK